MSSAEDTKMTLNEQLHSSATHKASSDPACPVCRASMKKILRVTMTVDYLIDVDGDGHTDVNGWTVPEVMEDWFTPPRIVHATRDAQRLGNSERVKSYEVLPCTFPKSSIT